MNNPRMTVKERNLVKGAVRRVFSRSELRRKILEASVVEHRNPNRPRVKKWSLCPHCNQIKPTYTFAVDHKIPVIAINRSLEEMTWDELIDNLWCEESNLQPVCEECHEVKTKAENKERRRIKNESKRLKKAA